MSLPRDAFDVLQHSWGNGLTIKTGYPVTLIGPIQPSVG